MIRKYHAVINIPSEFEMLISLKGYLNPHDQTLLISAVEKIFSAFFLITYLQIALYFQLSKIGKHFFLKIRELAWTRTVQLMKCHACLTFCLCSGFCTSVLSFESSDSDEDSCLFWVFTFFTVFLGDRLRVQTFFSPFWVP